MRRYVSPPAPVRNVIQSNRLQPPNPHHAPGRGVAKRVQRLWHCTLCVLVLLMAEINVPPPPRLKRL
jgi:hypothetical protein